MQAVRWIGVLVVVAVASACGASSKQIKTAKQAIYKCEYPVVWSAVREEFVDRYSNIGEEVAEAGVIVSLWEWYDSAGARKRGGDTVSVGPDDALFRIAVQVIEDNAAGGWRVVVEGGAQGHIPGASKTVPYKRGAIDEPGWVQTKIDNLAVGIHGRLSKYDIANAGGAVP